MTITTGPAIQTDPISTPSALRYRWLGIGLLGLAIGTSVNSMLGPLFADVIDYPLTETLLNQTRGLEAFSLAIIAPWSLTAGVLALRGHRAAPVFALAPALYAAYMSVQYLIGPNYAYYPPVFPLHLAIFILACAVTLTAWSNVERTHLPRTSRRVDRDLSAILIFLAAFVMSRYVPGIIDLPGQHRTAHHQRPAAHRCRDRGSAPHAMGAPGPLHRRHGPRQLDRGVTNGVPPPQLLAAGRLHRLWGGSSSH